LARDTGTGREKTMHANALDQMLEECLGNGKPISITLRDNSIIHGKIKNFDGYVIMLEDGPDTVIYRHSVLKLAEYRPEAARPQVAEFHQEQPDRASRMAGKNFRPQPHQQKKSRPRPDEQQSRTSQERPGEVSVLGEEMLKWLKSQKGNE
jgi:sRNA-binding regulator protein Hfq